MKLKTISIGILTILFLASLVYAVEFSPQGNINLKDRYNITGVNWIFGSISAENVKDPATACSSGYYMQGFTDNLSTVTCTDSGMVGSTWTTSQNASGYDLTDLGNLTTNGVILDSDEVIWLGDSYIYDNTTALIIGRK